MRFILFILFYPNTDNNTSFESQRGEEKLQGPRGWESNLPHFRAVFTNCIQWFINSCPRAGPLFLRVEISSRSRNSTHCYRPRSAQCYWTRLLPSQISIMHAKSALICRIIVFALLAQKRTQQDRMVLVLHMRGGGGQHGYSSLGCILDFAFRLNFIIQISLFVMWNKMYQSNCSTENNTTTFCR